VGGEGPFVNLAQAQRSALTGNAAEFRAAADQILESGFHDPEGLYFVARILARRDEDERAAALLDRIVAGGFCCFAAMSRDPWFERLRHRSDFREILRRAEASHREAAACFVREGGDRLLGLASPG